MYNRDPLERFRQTSGGFMQQFKVWFGILLIALLPGLTSCNKQKQPAAQWISLLNGRDLNDWTIKFAGHEPGENVKNTFRMRDSMLVVSYDQYENFDNLYGHIFYKTPFSHYRIRVEYRFVGDQVPGGAGWAYRNNGIMLHCQSPESMRIDQDFPVSIEAQILGGNGTDERPTGNVCTPGTNIVMNGELITEHCINSSSPTYHGDQWVTMECEVHGGGIIRHYVNGEMVLQYEQPQYDETDPDGKRLIKNGDKSLSSGYIALQAESHGIEFRKIEVMELNPEEI